MGKVDKFKQERLYTTHISKDGDVAKVIEYNSNSDVLIEFQDKYKAKIHTNWSHIVNGQIKNPYYPRIYNRGMAGEKYITYQNGDNIKEYHTWYNLFIRCYDEKAFIKHGTYAQCEVCDEWYLYENFYEWLHQQENFTQWLNNPDWDIDKDIIIKGNKIYTPDNCSLVPKNVNMLFLTNKQIRGPYPIGVTYDKRIDRYVARCNNPLTEKREYLGRYNSVTQAFLAYKKRKEQIIKQVAEQEYNKGNIIKKCYEAMMDYQVEITD